MNSIQIDDSEELKSSATDSFLSSNTNGKSRPQLKIRLDLKAVQNADAFSDAASPQLAEFNANIDGDKAETKSIMPNNKGHLNDHLIVSNGNHSTAPNALAENLINHTFEEHFILRLPPSVISKLSSTASSISSTNNAQSNAFSTNQKNSTGSKNDILGSKVNGTMAVNDSLEQDKLSLTINSPALPSPIDGSRQAATMANLSGVVGGGNEDEADDQASVIIDPSRIVIEMESERVAKVVIDQSEILVGVLLDLPTIVESYRTIDRRQYYKICDISRVLLCADTVNNKDGKCIVNDFIRHCVHEWPSTAAFVAHYQALGWRFEDGLTPPMASVRQRRFERSGLHLGGSGGGGRDDVAALADDIERQVAALLERDSAAIKSCYVLSDKGGTTLFRGGDSFDGEKGSSNDGAGGTEMDLDQDGDEDDEGSVMNGADSESQMTETIGDDQQSYTEAGTGTSYYGDDGDMEEDENFAAELEEELLLADTESTKEDAELMSLEGKSSVSLNLNFDTSHSVKSPLISEALADAFTLSSESSVTVNNATFGSATLQSSADIELQLKINERRAQLATLSNPLIRARLEDVIKQLEADLQRRQRE